MVRVDGVLIVALDKGGRPFEMRMAAPSLTRVPVQVRMFVNVKLLKDGVAQEHPMVALRNIGTEQRRGELGVHLWAEVKPDIVEQADPTVSSSRPSRKANVADCRQCR